jgi:hypothetical protein
MTFHDAFATILVGSAVSLYVLSQSTSMFDSLSVRAVSAFVFALGMGACMTTRDEMAALFAKRADRTASLGYVVVASITGAAALVASVMAAITGWSTALDAQIVAIVALWLMATVRHALSPTV